jgi:hypothetical protein
MGRVLYITGEISPTVEDLVINIGSATGLGGNDYAGTTPDLGGWVYIMTASRVLLRPTWAWTSAERPVLRCTFTYRWSCAGCKSAT